jgi:hypothetical protein
MAGRTVMMRLGRYLIRRACRYLPADARDERYREWTAELPAILGDPDIRSRTLRAARTLRFAAGQRRAARRLARAAGISRRKAVTIRIAGAGTAGGLACMVVGVHLADHASLDDNGIATQGTAMAFFGAFAVATCLVLIATVTVVSSAGRLWRRLRRPRPGSS